MKVMQINCVYGRGSTGKIVADIHRELLNNGMQSIVCYGRGARTSEENIYKVSSEFGAKIHSALSRLFGVEFSHSSIATAQLIQRIAREKPDVVHLHCLNGHFVHVYKLLDYLKKQNIKTVLTLHAEIMHTAVCSHALECEKWKVQCHDCDKIKGKISRFYRDDAVHTYRLMQSAFKGFKNLTVVGVSEWLTARAKQSPVFDAPKFCTIRNGINIAVFHRTDSADLKSRLKIPADKKIILHVTPDFLSVIKGGQYVLELARKMPEYQFIIVGFNGDKSILPENIIAIAHTNNAQELAKYYSMADCLICTSLRESFPTVCLEAAACGCNIVGFRTGGLPETIPEDMGTTVECYDIDAMCEAVRQWSACKVSDARIQEVNQMLSAKEMYNHYMHVYENV